VGNSESIFEVAPDPTPTRRTQAGILLVAGIPKQIPAARKKMGDLYWDQEKSNRSALGITSPYGGVRETTCTHGLREKGNRKKERKPTEIKSQT